jgi:hypothetical protein
MISRLLVSRTAPAAFMVWLGLAANVCVAASSPGFTASEIPLEAELQGLWTGDFDGNAARDVMVAVWSEQRGRELLIYLQASDAKFPAQPSRRIEVKSDIVAVALADTRPAPGDELIFLTRSAGYSFSPLQEQYAGNLNHLFDWELLLAVPQRKELRSLGRLVDIDGDGHGDLLLPGRAQYGLFRAGGDDSFAFMTYLPRGHGLPRPVERESGSLQVSSGQGLQFDVSRPSPFSGLVAPPSDSTDSAILDIARWLPAVSAARVNDDARLDLVYLDDVETGSSKGRLNVLLQNADGSFADVPDRRAEFDSKGSLTLVDFDGDGLADVMSEQQDGTDETTLRFFRNRDGHFSLQTPDYVMKFSGYDVSAELVDVNADGRPELIVSYYAISVADALRDGSVVRSTLIYRGSTAPDPTDTTSPFGRRPDARLEERFSAATFKGLTQRVSFASDVDGDGQRDVLAIDHNGALIARSVDAAFRVESHPFWRFVPLHLIQGIHAVDLNGDAPTDFVLEHQHSMTLLVSQP